MLVLYPQLHVSWKGFPIDAASPAAPHEIPFISSTTIIATRALYAVWAGGTNYYELFYNMAEDEPVWRALAHELGAVVRAQGPLPLGDVAGVFRAEHGKPMKLGGYKLRDCLREKGHLLGALHINWKTGMLEMKRKKRGAASKAATAAPTITIRPGTGTACSAATPPTVPPPDNCLASYHLINGVQSCSQALIAMSPEDEGGAVSLSLRRICRGRAIAVELEGSGLRAEKGQVSLVKVCH